MASETNSRGKTPTARRSVGKFLNQDERGWTFEVVKDCVEVGLFGGVKGTKKGLMTLQKKYKKKKKRKKEKKTTQENIT